MEVKEPELHNICRSYHDWMKGAHAALVLKNAETSLTHQSNIKHSEGEHFLTETGTSKHIAEKVSDKATNKL